MVPTFTWGLVLLYFFLAISASSSPACRLFLREWLWWWMGAAGRKTRTLPRLLGDDLLDQALRERLVVVELHGVVGTALRHGPQLRRVTEHVRQRHLGMNDLAVRPPLHAEDVAPAAAEGAH